MAVAVFMCIIKTAQHSFFPELCYDWKQKKETFKMLWLESTSSALLVKAMQEEPVVPDQISLLQMEVTLLTAASQSYDIVL